MMTFREMKIGRKLNMILAGLLAVLIVITSLLSYQRQRRLIITFVTATSRYIAGTVSREMGVVKPAYFYVEPRRNLPPYHYKQRLQDLINSISMRDRYFLRILSFERRSTFFLPTAAEDMQMKILAERKLPESNSIITDDGVPYHLYLRPLIIERACLNCHGDAATAPAEVRSLYPPGSKIYGHKEGDLVGAVGVKVPMADISEEVWNTIRHDVAVRLVTFILILLVVRGIIFREILDPLRRLVKEVTEACDSDEVRGLTVTGGAGEIGEMIAMLNKLIGRMALKTIQYRESEERYRSLVELAEIAIFTINGEGKILISNRAAETLLGYEKAELTGMDFFQFLDNDVPARGRFANCKASDYRGETDKLRCRVKSREEWVDAQMSITALDCEKQIFAVRLWQADQEGL